MTTTVRQVRGSAVEQGTGGFKARPTANDSRDLLAGRDLKSPIGSSCNPIPPTDSPQYAALQRCYGTKGWLGSL